MFLSGESRQAVLSSAQLLEWCSRWRQRFVERYARTPGWCCLAVEGMKGSEAGTMDAMWGNASAPVRCFGNRVMRHRVCLEASIM